MGDNIHLHVSTVNLAAQYYFKGQWFRDQGWVNVTSGSQEALKVAIASRGPVSVAIDAGHKSLSFYSNGQLNQ